MLEYRNLNSTMETRDHLKNGASLKSLMSKGILFCFVSLTVLFSSCETKVEACACAGLSAIFDSEGGAKDIEVSCSAALMVISCPEWITVAKTGNTGNQTFHLTASKNESSNMRTGSVKLDDVKKKAAVVATISVTQFGNEDSLHETAE